jgi:PAS domain-containing protein
LHEWIGPAKLIGWKAAANHMQQPELLILEGTVGSGIRGACTACARVFHAFIRSTEKEALRVLNRGFNMHCRLRHGVVIRPAFAGSEVEQIFADLDLPAYVLERSTRRLLAANAQFKELMGYQEGVADLKLEDLRLPEEVPMLLETMPNHRGQGMLERLYRTKDGRVLQVNVKYQDVNLLLENDRDVPDACFVVLTNVVA